MPKPLQNPEKELRFTRAGQATGWWIAVAMALAASLTIAACAWFGALSWWWVLAPLPPAVVAARLALRMTRHAYLILTPLGLEIFPLWRPDRTMRLVTWQEIHSAEVDESLTRLTLHHDAERSGGIHLSLSPVQPSRRALLAKAILGRLDASRPS